MNRNRRRHLFNSILLCMSVGWLIVGVSDRAFASSRSPVLYEHNYYPGRYYSRYYLQQPYKVPPNTVPKHPVLVPYQSYGRHEIGKPYKTPQGVPLTNGRIGAERFPYRYQLDFKPVPKRVVPLPDLCDPDVRIQRFRVPQPPVILPRPAPSPMVLEDAIIDP